MLTSGFVNMSGFAQESDESDDGDDEDLHQSLCMWKAKRGAMKFPKGTSICSMSLAAPMSEVEKTLMSTEVSTESVTSSTSSWTAESRPPQTD